MKYGMIPSPPDERDYSLAKAISYSASPIQERMVSYIPRPVNQGEFGVCAAVTLSEVIEAIEFKQRGVVLPISVKYMYGNRTDRMFQGEGMMPRELLQMATKFGAVRYDLLPGLANYPDSKAAITSALDGEGLPSRPYGYVRLQGIQDVNDYMVKYDLPVFFGMYLTPSFFGTMADGIVPPPEGDILGGHAIVVIGIKRINEKWYLVLQNSWGTGWGDNGRCYVCLDDKHRGLEMWGIIPEATELLTNRPQQILMTIGKNEYYVDNVRKTMDVSPFIKDDRTYVPLRFMVEALGARVTPIKYPDGTYVILSEWGGEQNGGS